MDGHVDVVAIIATLPSRHALLMNALASVAAQTRPLDATVVVVDYEEGFDMDEQITHITRAYARSGGNLKPLAVLPNTRTRNVSGTGAWNTGIHHTLKEWGERPSSCFVAVLDDDDEWMPDHIAACTQVIHTQPEDRVVWVVSGIERRRGTQLRVDIPCAPLTVDEFLVGNPGIQGSNIFMELRTLLAAGTFNEYLDSM